MASGAAALGDSRSGGGTVLRVFRSGRGGRLKAAAGLPPSDLERCAQEQSHVRVGGGVDFAGDGPDGPCFISTALFVTASSTFRGGRRRLYVDPIFSRRGCARRCRLGLRSYRPPGLDLGF